ncbi:MAG: GAF domain-containing protein [Desulfobulbaceae bacterium]|nr:MAG: GAF domain-containing protein [Desulfobulbaceae bacterium]
MGNMKANPFDRNKLAGDILNEWQTLLNVAAEILDVPAGLITRLDGNEIEILLSSESAGNPYMAEYVTHYPDSGWYCERTLKSRGLNVIPNALLDPDWKDNPAAVGLHMISYIGLPIERPDGGEFGTVCFLDNKENAHNDLHVKLLHQIKRMIELSLRIVFDKEEIERRDHLFDDLSKIYPICSYCKKIREASGDWVAVENYLRDVTGALPSHGVCPQCFEMEMKKL